MRPESATFLWDALQAATSIVQFLEGVSPEGYADDLLRRRAVERELEIVGEALNGLRRIDPGTADRIPGLREAIGLRNVLIHGYAEIVDRRVYETAVDDVPALVETLRLLLAEAGAP